MRDVIYEWPLKRRLPFFAPSTGFPVPVTDVEVVTAISVGQKRSHDPSVNIRAPNLAFLQLPKIVIPTQNQSQHSLSYHPARTHNILSYKKSSLSYLVIWRSRFSAPYLLKNK